MKIAITQIRLDGGTQTRAEIDLTHASEIADAIRNGVALPPVVVFYDGSDHWLADGFHRVTGAKSAGVTEIDADVRQGTRRDAVLFSVGANATHGLKRTNADKRRAVETLLRDEEWAKWSDREIARCAGVHHDLVGKVRADIRPSGGNRQIPEVRTVERNGVTYQQDTSKIGRKPARERSDIDLAEEDDADDDDSDGLVVVPDVEPVRSESLRSTYGGADVASAIAAVASSSRRFESEVRAVFQHADPRFSAELRERAQDFLLNVAEVVREFLPPTSDAPKRAFGVIRGGKS